MVPCIASTKPRAIASPRPTPALLLVAWSSRRWKGANDRLALGRRDAGTAVDHAQFDDVGVRAGRHPDLLVGRRVAKCVLHQVGHDAFEQAGVGEHLGQGGRDVDVEFLVARRVVQSAAHHVVESDRAGRHGQHSRLQTGQVEQVGHQTGEPIQRVVGAREQFLAVALTPRDVGTAQAGHGRLGRRDRSAQIVADGVEQRGSHPVGLNERHRRLGRLGEPALFVGHGDLRGEGGEYALVLGGQGPPAQREDQVVSDGHLGVSVLGPKARVLTHRGHARPRAAQAPGRALTPVGADARRRVGVAAQQGDAVHCERLADPFEQRRQGLLAAQQAAREGRHRLGLGVRARRLGVSARGQVDHARHQGGDDDKHHQRKDILRLGDRELVDRGDEVEVEQQTGDDRGGEGGVEPADEADDDHDQ